MHFHRFFQNFLGFQNFRGGFETSYPSRLLRSCVKLGRNINFKRHMENTCCKAKNKTKALFRISIPYLEKAQIFARTYILYNFTNFSNFTAH